MQADGANHYYFSFQNVMGYDKNTLTWSPKIPFVSDTGPYLWFLAYVTPRSQNVVISSQCNVPRISPQSRLKKSHAQPWKKEMLKMICCVSFIVLMLKSLFSIVLKSELL